MKFSITIDTGYRDIPKEKKMRLRKEKLKAELNKALGEGSVYDIYITSFMLQ